jgi:hypothetical protein
MTEILWYLALFLSFLFVNGGYRNPSTSHNVKKSKMSLQRAERLGESLATLPPDTVVLIDGDNVRGKTSFSVSKEQLLQDLHCFKDKFGLHDKLQLYYDHGRWHEAYKCDGLSVVFSGEKTADDIIARDVAWWKDRFKAHVMVVTADSGLKARCHRAVRLDNKALTVIDSNLFLELMDALTAANRTTSSGGDGIASISTPTNSTSVTADNMLDMSDLLRLELRLRDQVRSFQRLSKVRSGGRKKRVQFTRRLREIESRLQDCLDKQGQRQGANGADGGSSSSISSSSSSSSDSKMARLDMIDESMLAEVLRENSDSRGLGRARREETWERCILAERLRKKLMRSLVLPPVSAASSSFAISNDSSFSAVSVGMLLGAERGAGQPSDVYIREVNRNFSRTEFERLLLMPEAQARLEMFNTSASDGSGLQQ